jgi:hypothetical protein
MPAFMLGGGRSLWVDLFVSMILSQGGAGIDEGTADISSETKTGIGAKPGGGGVAPQ